MSKIISELVGKRCKMKTSDATFITDKIIDECTVLAVDDEWIKITFIDAKKKLEATKILRIESIDMIELIAQ